MQLTDEQLATITTAAEGQGGTVDVTYSGRAMCGRRCVSITTDDPVHGFVWHLAATLARTDTELADLLCESDLRVDSMGLGAVIYWADVQADPPGGLVRIATDRDEGEPCQRGTVGCCVDHDMPFEHRCETW